LGLALDEQRETDDVFQVDGYTFLVEKSLNQTAAPIQIDGNQFGFRVNSNLNLSQGADSGCSSCTSC
jgi:hypothetical protein